MPSGLELAPSVQPGVSLYRPDRLTRFAEAVLMAGGSGPAEARAVAGHLVDSDLAGHPSHGVGLIPMYVDHRLRGLVEPNRRLREVEADDAVLTLDADGGYGRPAGEAAMDRAISLVRRNGLSAVSLRNAHHLGRIGAFGEMAAAAGLIAIQFVSVQSLAPMVAPHGGIEPRLSTNPLCIAVPRGPAAPLLLDISTSAIANNKARVAAAEGRPLPQASAIDHRGVATDDPAVLLHDPRGAILPLGLHKGYGLALVCELLAGILSGAGSIVDRPIANGIVNNMLTICIDPKRFAGGAGLDQALDRLADFVTGSTPIDPRAPVRIPGEPEADARSAAARNGGVPLATETICAMIDAAIRIGLESGQAEGMLA